MTTELKPTWREGERFLFSLFCVVGKDDPIPQTPPADIYLDNQCWGMMTDIPDEWSEQLTNRGLEGDKIYQTVTCFKTYNPVNAKNKRQYLVFCKPFEACLSAANLRGSAESALRQYDELVADGVISFTSDADTQPNSNVVTVRIAANLDDTGNNLASPVTAAELSAAIAKATLDAQGLQIKVGDVVRLNTGSPRMSVLASTPRLVICGWFHRSTDGEFGGYNRAEFPPAVLIQTK